MISTSIVDEQFWELIETIWSTMLNLPVLRARALAHESSGPAASVRLHGAFRGVVQFLPSERFARRATARMLDVPEDSLTSADVDDAMGELCNMLGGGVKSLVPGPTGLSLPSVSRRSRPAPSVQRRQVAAELRFTCEGEPLEVRVLNDQVA